MIYGEGFQYNHVIVENDRFFETLSKWEELMKKKVWVLVANSKQARVFKSSSNATLEEVEGLIHPKSAFYNQDLATDKLNPAGKGPHGAEVHMDPKTHEMRLFSKEVADYLEGNQEEYEKLYISASPQFLGMLRQSIGANVQKCVVDEFNTDITSLNPEQIRDRLPYVL